MKVTLEELSLQKDTLQSAQDTLLTIFNGVYDSIVIHDELGNVITANENFLNLYRVESKEATNFTIAKDYSSDKNDKFLAPEYIKRAISGEVC